MSKSILKMAGIGLIAVLVVLAVVYVSNLGSQIRLSGEIQMVRVQAMDADSCVVIADFGFKNPADYPFVVRDATLHLRDADGNTMQGTAVAAGDAKRVFDYYSKANPELGPQYNDVMIVRDRVEPGEEMDRMIMARFDVPASAAEARSGLTLRIEDVDGAITELTEEPAAE